MKMKKEFKKFQKGDWTEEGYNYTIKYTYNEDYVFINSEGIVENDTAFINILNLADKNFLEEHNIDYIIDKDNKIIPIGIVNFIKNNENEKKYNSMYLKLICNDDNNLYKSNEILESIDKAIKIKYEAIKFIGKVGSVEEIELV